MSKKKSADLINDDVDSHEPKATNSEIIALDPLKSTNYFALYDAFRDLCVNNAEYFRTDDSENGQRFHCAYMGLIEHVEIARRYVNEIKSFANEYDFDEHVLGNGYRSFLLVVRACINHGLKLSSHVIQNRGSLLFRKSLYMKEVEACCHLLASLCTCLQHLMTLREWSEPGSLFPAGVHTASELFATADSINQYCFYGRCIGVQYCESIQSVLKFLAICMAGFSEAYYKEGSTFAKTTSSMWTSGKYYWNPELRARRIVNISQNAEIDFCKSFWSLAESELMHTLPSVIGTAITINKMINIPSEPLQIQNTITNEWVNIAIPSSHLGSGSVSARLMSYHRREGMMGEKGKKPIALAPATGLIFHCHGGGFVAQSSKSHELYLRDWAVALDVPILSIDYSLAPDAPFPRAIEEVFYAYCWALKNAAFLGTTAETIILAGDSAGANLNLACAINCINHSIRVPDGIFLVYCPVRISFDPSPARLLCLMDPLLPFGFMMRCLKAYACPSSVVLEQNRRLVAEKDAIKNAKPLSVSSTAENLRLSGSETDMRTFVNINGDTIVRNKADNSAGSLDGSSLWEQIENDFARQELDKSHGSDGTSDTFASASLHSLTVGNTEMMTPDESNGISFEEDSQPITIHKEKLIENEVEPSNNSETTTERIVNGADEKSDEKSTASAKYVGEFVQRYVLDTDDGLDKPVLRSVPVTQAEETLLLDQGRDMLSVQNIQNKIYQVVENVTNTVSQTITCMTASAPIRECNQFSHLRTRLDSLIPKSASEEFVFDIPRDPLLSPFWASDEVLSQFPATHILTVDMDPCLDDCVMFAKRLKSLKINVGLDILPGLPHGFLNFVKLSKDAHDGNKVCVKRLSELLKAAVRPLNTFNNTTSIDTPIE